jgi:hypothetical protein
MRTINIPVFPDQGGGGSGGNGAQGPQGAVDSMTPVDTSKFLFQQASGYNPGGTIFDIITPLQFKNIHPTLAVYIVWMRFTGVVGVVPMITSYTPATIDGNGIGSLISMGNVRNANESGFSTFPAGMTGADSTHYLGSVSLTEVCGWVFSRAANDSFGHSASSYAAFPDNVVGAQSFKFNPGLVLNFDFTYQDSGD